MWLLSEIHWAKGTLKWPLIGVNPNVALQIHLFREGHWAKGTMIWPLIRVTPHVAPQMWFTPEYFCAEGTLIFLILIVMNLHVSLQVMVLPEGLATNRTLERPHVVVN